jgi:hypothetical protein
VTTRTPARLYGPTALSNSAADLYTSPASTITTVRQIHFQNPGAAITVTMSIGADGTGTRLFSAKSIPTGDSDHFGYWVLAAAEKIQGSASVASQVVVSIFGDKVT